MKLLTENPEKGMVRVLIGLVGKTHVDSRLALPVLVLDIILDVDKLRNDFLVGIIEPVSHFPGRLLGGDHDQSARWTHAKSITDHHRSNRRSMFILIRGGGVRPEAVLRVQVLDVPTHELLQSHPLARQNSKLRWRTYRVTIPNAVLAQHVHIGIHRANRVVGIPVNIAVGCLGEVAIAARREPDTVFGQGHLGLGPIGRISGHAKIGLSFVVPHRVVQGVKFLSQLVRWLRGEGEVPILGGVLHLKGKSGVVV